MKRATRTVRLAPARDGGLYPIYDKGGKAAAHELCAIVYPSTSEVRRALSIIRRYFPQYRANGAELHIYGIPKNTKGKK